jgi:hypothetical protein
MPKPYTPQFRSCLWVQIACRMCLPRNIPIALLLGRLQLSVSSCLSEYWKLSSRILRQDGRVTEAPLFGVRVFREMMENAVLKVKILQLDKAQSLVSNLPASKIPCTCVL